MNDLDAVLTALQEGAIERGLVIVDAAFLSEPTFAVHAESTSPRDALDLVQRMLAPFVSISVDVFDADEFLDEFAGEATDEMSRLARERDGQMRGVGMRWFGLGANGLYLAGTDWAEELDAMKARWDEDQRSNWADARDTRAVRVAHLADQIELDPRYRSVGQNQRTTIGELVADELRTADDDATTVRWALERASKAVRQNAAAAYLPLSESLDATVDELRETDDWRESRTAKEREGTVRTFLLRKTGYAPTAVLAETVARHAFARR